MHLDEEQVQRLLHGELSGAADKSAREHLAGCPTCRERIALARREEDDVHALLRELDHRPPRVRAGALVLAAHGRGAAWRRRAAGLLVAMGVAGAAYALPGSPVPRWVESVVERIGSLGGPPARTPAAPPPEATPSPLLIEPESTGGIAVAPGRALLILFTSAQDEGRVLVSLSDGAEVRVLAPAGAATFTTDVNRLLIDNTGSTATFTIEVPRAAPRVEVRVAGKRIFLKEGPRVTAEPAASAGSYSIPLAP